MSNCTPPNPGNPPQTLTVQYDGVTTFDGVTASVPFSRDPRSADYIEPDDNGIYHVPQNGPLGLIDPDLGVGGSMGDRWIPWMLVVVDAADNLEVVVVDAEGNVALETVEPLQLVPSSLYRNQRFRVPQGGLIRVSGDPGVAGRLRLRIMLEPDTCCDSAGSSSSSGDTTVVDQNQQVFFGGVNLTGDDGVPLFASWIDADMNAVASSKSNLVTRRSATISGVALFQLNAAIGSSFTGLVTFYDNTTPIRTVGPVVVPYNTPTAVAVDPPLSVDALTRLRMAITPDGDYTSLALQGSVDLSWGAS